MQYSVVVYNEVRLIVLCNRNKILFQKKKKKKKSTSKPRDVL